MRACMLFVTGLLVGVALTSVAAQSRIVDCHVNHIGMNVPNLDEAVAYYTKTLGFPEAFRVNDEKGQARLVYLQISKNTFFEIQPAPGRPAAINHVGIHVENMAAATDMLRIAVRTWARSAQRHEGDPEQHHRSERDPDRAARNCLRPRSSSGDGSVEVRNGVVCAALGGRVVATGAGHGIGTGRLRQCG